MFQFLNLDNASKAEKEILHTILFKDGHHQRKEFFKDLMPEYDPSLDVENDVHQARVFGDTPQHVTHHDIDNTDTSSAADITVEDDPGMPNDIAINNMRSQGEQQMRTYFTSAPVPHQNPHAGGAHPLGHHPQLSMYHHQMMQNQPGQFMPQYPVIPVPYGAGAHHNMLPTHLPQQYMPTADVPVQDLHMHQKLHDMHNSPGGAPHTAKFRLPKNNRPRRAEEAYHSHPQYYSNVNYPPPQIYYTTQPSVTNMTGTPLIMPGSGAPAPMYHQVQGHYPQMYPPMLGNEHIHQQQPHHGMISQRGGERIGSPKTIGVIDNNTFTGATTTNGDGLSNDNERPQRTENVEVVEPNSINLQPQEQTELQINTGDEEVETGPSSSERSPKPPQPSQENENPTPTTHVPVLASSAPESSWNESLNGNGNIADSLPKSEEPKPLEQKQNEQLPETTLVEDVANVPSKPEPKTWSSTVNGGISPTASVPTPNASSVPTLTPTTSTTTAPKVVTTKKESKDSAEFPQLSSAQTIPTTVAPATTSATATSATQSTSQPKAKSWASIASRQTIGAPTNGAQNTISNDQAKKLIAESLSHVHVDNASKQTMENDSSVGLYNASQEPVYENDPVALKLGEFLSNYVLDHHTFSLTPRGLSNQNNFCYINATLQALVACPPFVNLFRSLNDIIGKKACKSTPIIQSMYDFIMEFEPITRHTQQRMRKTNEPFYVGANFEASGIRKVLGLLDGATFKVEGRQQDAEEFLSHLLNALHDEMIKVIKWSETKKEKSAQSKSGQSSKEPLTQPTVTDEDDDEQWQVMGPKNKGCMTRKTSLSKSPISEMFGGQMCSALNRANSLKSTTLQPFFTLQLDIQSDNIHSIRDALEGLSVKEEVTGCVTSNGLETEAWKQMSLEVLPAILILHMKRFVFDTNLNTIRKLDKRVDFSIDLEIPKDLLSVNSKSKYTPKQRLYKLFAVVYHDGEEAIKGHYIADTFHPSGGSLWGQFGWIRYDDTAVKGVGENQILNPQSPRVPYLLYYRRVDTLQTKKDRS